MGEIQLREWFEKIMSHAVTNYSVDGWDCFVECVDFVDFTNAALRRNRETGQPSFYTYEDAFEHYRELCKAKADQREEQYAMAREGW